MTLDEQIKFCEEKIKNIRLKTSSDTFVDIKKNLEELQQYRAIGTVEEYIDAVVKQEAKMVIGIHKANASEDIETYGKETLFGDCPVCGELQNTLWNIQYCGDCGQKLDWSGEE